MKTPIYFSKSTDACDFIFKSVGPEVRLAAPLGLGKPNVLLNHLYDRVSTDAKLKLRIYTALSLALPSVKEELAKLFFEPFAQIGRAHV